MSDMRIDAGQVKRNRWEEFDLLAKQAKAGDFTSTFQKMGTMIGDALRTGQVRESQSAASSL